MFLSALRAMLFLSDSKRCFPKVKLGEYHFAICPGTHSSFLWKYFSNLRHAALAPLFSPKKEPNLATSCSHCLLWSQFPGFFNSLVSMADILSHLTLISHSDSHSFASCFSSSAWAAFHSKSTGSAMSTPQQITNESPQWLVGHLQSTLISPYFFFHHLVFEIFSQYTMSPIN